MIKTRAMKYEIYIAKCEIFFFSFVFFSSYLKLNSCLILGLLTLNYILKQINQHTTFHSTNLLGV